MPDTRYGGRSIKSNAAQGSSNATPNNLDEAMWLLKVHEEENETGGGADAGGTDYHDTPLNDYRFPDRPGVPDCLYFLRTGQCGYGSNCKYNHPNHIYQGNENGYELPERVGQPDCQYFLKTGSCKFGVSCKYHHPKDKQCGWPMMNILGLPIRQNEKSCPYYMRNGSCKFGIICKFNHPQPSTVGTVYPPTGFSPYDSTGLPLAAPTTLPLIGSVPAWSLSRSSYMSNSRLQGLSSYVPFMVAPQGTMPLQHGWSTYMGTLGNIASAEMAGPSQPSNSKQLGLNTSMHLPERPEQPECLYYMKTGSCKYGVTCKYHHPKGRINTVEPVGYPLRPGQAVCASYSTYGTCTYGSACKFDHPLMGYYNYASVHTFPMSDSYFPQQRSSGIVWSTEETSTKAWNHSDQSESTSIKPPCSESDNHPSEETPQAPMGDSAKENFN